MAIDPFTAAAEYRGPRIARARLRDGGAARRAGQPFDNARNQGRIDVALDFFGTVNAQRPRIFGDAQIVNAAGLAGQQGLQ